MFTARKKISKEGGVLPTELEDEVAKALFDLEVNSNDLKADLKDLTFLSAKEVEVTAGKKAIVVVVPFRQIQSYHKIQRSLVRELEKKFSGKHVVVIAQRRIIAKPGKSSHKKMQKRPFSRTATAVHQAMLEDIVYPTEIVGKRTRIRQDQTKLHKIYLDPKDQTNQEYKLETFAAVYKRLAGKTAVFEFPHTQ